MLLLMDQQRFWSAPSGHTQCLQENSQVVCGCRVPAKHSSVRELVTLESSSEGDSIPVHSWRSRQDLLWRQYFQDPALWWDNRQDKKTSRSPDFRHKRSKEVLWLNNVYKPSWVESQLATLDGQVESMSHCHTPFRVQRYEPDSRMVEACSNLCEQGQLTEAVHALGALVQTGSFVSSTLFHTVLTECVKQKKLVLGQHVHTLAVKAGYQSDTYLANHFLRMYASHGKMKEAMQVFVEVIVPDTFLWVSIISAHAEHGQPAQAIRLYKQMRRSTVMPNSYVFVAALKACASSADLEAGRQVHANVIETGLVLDKFLVSCLVDMYSKCGSLEDARMVFDSFPTRDVVTWTAMIAGYAEQGLGQEALALYASMEQEGIIVANRVTFACLIKACTGVGALQLGKRLHSQIVQRGLERDVVVGSCLVDMYAKCGSLEEALRVFDTLPERNVITWTAMLNGFGQSNDGQRAIKWFQKMLRDGVQPNGATFICLLVACSHDGLVNEGRRYFKAMVEDHGIVPTRQHFACMVDLFGRSGELDEAENMLRSMPFESDFVGWLSLLNACRSHGDIERGRRCFEVLIESNPQHAAAYMLMANMYADYGRWTDVDAIEILRKSAGARKKPGKAGIEVNRQVHTFVVGDERDDISSKIRIMKGQLKDGGHVPHTQLVLRPVSEKEKEDVLCGHAEKLALAYGLLNTPDGTPLLVTKNLRMCTDCHSATQIMSRTEKRNIVVRDSHRVHNFMDGTCSCGDRP